MAIKAQVTILLATFNRAHLIEETLLSIQNQTFTNFKCYIIDDHSTDHTRKVVEEFCRKDDRFEYFLKPIEYAKGLSATRNFGLDLAKRNPSEFIQFFDDDDLMHPLKLEIQTKALKKNLKAQFSLCGAKNFKNKSEINFTEIQQKNNPKNLSLGEAYLIGTIKFVAQVPLFRWSYAKKFAFDEELFYAEEWVLFSMQFLSNRPTYEMENKVLFYRRKHLESITEREDIDFSRRKASAITGVKVFEFLNKHNLHTKVTLFFFARNYLLYRFTSVYIEQIGKDLKDLDRRFYYRFLLAKKFHVLLRKVILKLLKY